MKAVVFHDVGKIALEEVPDPKIEQGHDAIVRLTMTAICGTDLHFVRGTQNDIESGTILGHEGVGIVEEVGTDVRNLNEGDRVVIPSTIGCGYCSYCRAGYFAQCDNANPNGPQAGTCFFGGPKQTGPIPGLQTERARIPYANVGLVKLPNEIENERAIILSDIFPTGYFGAALAEIKSSETVVVFGCGPVGLCAIASAFLFGAGRVLAVDRAESRLEMAKTLGAEIINFDDESPVEKIKELTGGIGADRVIDAVGVDAVCPQKGPGYKEAKNHAQEFEKEIEQLMQASSFSSGDLWQPGDAPSQALRWAVQSVAKAGTLAIIGVYPSNFGSFPIGLAMNKNLTINSGNCNHRKYIPTLIGHLQNGTCDLNRIVTHVQPFADVISSYMDFDRRISGCIKVALEMPV